MNIQPFILFTGMERELGGETHDGPIRRGEYNFRVSIGRLQSSARIHWRLHFLVDALQGSQPDVERRDVSQTHRGLGLKDPPQRRSTDDSFISRRRILRFEINFINTWKPSWTLRR